MNEPKNNQNVEWCNIENKECLKFTFEGKLIEKDAIGVVKRWEELFSSKKNQKFVLIWECTKMIDYEPQVRFLWQNTLKKFKDQIDSIWLIADSKKIYAGAMIITVFTDFEVKVVESPDQINFSK